MSSAADLGVLRKAGQFCFLIPLAMLLMAASPTRPITEHLDGPEERIAHCVRKAARGRLWLERTLWGLRDQEAGWIGAEIRNANGTFDLGPLQINSWWVPRIARLIGQPEASVRTWLRFDPCFNAEAARWIFLSGFSSTGDYWQAIGAYHSPTAWRRRHYIAKVVARLRHRFGEEVFIASRPADPVR